MRQMINSGGGQAATAACALARLGHRVSYAGAVGDDDTGSLALPRLVTSLGSTTGGSGGQAPGAARSQEAFILVRRAGGERTIVWTRDEACCLEPRDLDREPRSLPAGCCIWTATSFELASLEAARVARASGAVVTLDAEKGCGMALLTSWSTPTP